MGPGRHASPSRPKFSWDIRFTPWTACCRKQEGLAHAVKPLKTFHDKLLATNFNKTAADRFDIGLRSQLSGRALGVTKNVSSDIIANQGVAANIDALHSPGVLSAVSEVNADFTDLLALRCEWKERFRNYEARFAAQVSKLNARGTTVSLYDSWLKMMLPIVSFID